MAPPPPLGTKNTKRWALARENMSEKPWGPPKKVFLGSPARSPPPHPKPVARGNKLPPPRFGFSSPPPPLGTGEIWGPPKIPRWGGYFFSPLFSPGGGRDGESLTSPGGPPKNPMLAGPCGGNKTPFWGKRPPPFMRPPVFFSPGLKTKVPLPPPKKKTTRGVPPPLWGG